MSESGAAHRNHRGGGQNAVGIGLVAQVLDVHTNAADHQVEKVLPIAGVLAKHQVGVGIDLDGAAVGDLQDKAWLSGPVTMVWVTRTVSPVERAIMRESL